jgi:hypothetical protein
MLTISPNSAAIKRYCEELAREVDLLAAVGVTDV